MARAKGFSLWLMPSGDLYEALAHTILRLSRVYQTPAFEPHVTLLGELTEPETEVLSKTQHLASLIRPCEIRLSRADYLSDYFRCLFLRVEETEPVMAELVADLRRMIEETRAAVAATVNAGLTMLYWQIGRRIGQEILKGERAEYGKEIVATLSQQ